MQITINASRTADARNRLIAIPPVAMGLSMKSPTTAPRGRVRMNAVQKSAVREIFDR